jgi:exosortase
MVTSAQPAPLQQTRALVRAALGVVTLAALWLVLCRHLSNEWSINEQYNYGWFVPFFALYFFWARWEQRPDLFHAAADAGSPAPFAPVIGIVALLLLLPLRLFEIGNPDWRPLGWVHASVVVTLTLLVIWRAGGRSWLRHFAFPVAFIFVAVPWISPIEQPIVQGLMRVAATVATEAIRLLGIPAQLEGSLIRVNTGVVGVNEACSGVRSLQTSIMIGLLFGELKRLSTWQRVTLVLASVSVALMANLGRAFFLVWIAATRNLPAVDRWHDIAGYIIIALVFLGSLGIATWLARGNLPGAARSDGSPAQALERKPGLNFSLISPGWIIGALCWLLLVEIASAAWYREHEIGMSPRLRWTVRWPESAYRFRQLRIDEGVRSTLRFDEGREALWSISLSGERDAGALRPGAHDPPVLCYLFLFRWNPGTSSILRARAHRPDVCLPNAGWRQTAEGGIREYPVAEHFSLPFRHFAFERIPPAGGRTVFAHAFFCLTEDAVRPDEDDPRKRISGGTTDWAIADRFRAVREGLRNPGQQVMEFVIITTRQLSNENAESEFANFVPDLIDLLPSHKTAPP